MLIVLEGLDGAGKSTQINLLQTYFEKRSTPVRFIHFPRFDSPVFGELIAKFLRGDLGKIEEVHPMLVALLFAGDRKEASSQINDWLKMGCTVILDRYVYSNIAFQCAKCSDESEASGLRDWILDTEYNEFGIPRPDMNLFLDVPI
ncbi:MAG: thymidylate kinase, partial [Bacteroidales bacterium]|nr:thymidylate kinase [Bacteroidales bacterium]